MVRSVPHAREDRRTLDLPVRDVPAAVRFYCTVFETEEVDAAQPGAPVVGVGERLQLRVVAEETHVPGRGDRGSYVRGKTPRLELQVDDVDLQVARWSRAGAALRCALVAEGAAIRVYAHVIDPYGHLWAFTRADEP